MIFADFLMTSASRRRVAGVHDCCTWPAEWAMACGRPDPMSRWRGAYHDEASAEEIIFAHGGLVGLFSIGMDDAGIPAATDLTIGDLGVVSLGEDQAGAVFTGRRWALVADRGLAFASFNRDAVLGVWRP